MVFIISCEIVAQGLMMSTKLDWVDSVFGSLTPEQRIRQLIWIQESDNEIIQEGYGAIPVSTQCIDVNTLRIRKIQSLHQVLSDSVQYYSRDYLTSLSQNYWEDFIEFALSKDSVDIFILPKGDNHSLEAFDHFVEEKTKEFSLLFKSPSTFQNDLEVQYLDDFQNIYPQPKRLNYRWKTRKWQPDLVVQDDVDVNELLSDIIQGTDVFLTSRNIAERIVGRLLLMCSRENKKVRELIKILNLSVKRVLGLKYHALQNRRKSKNINLGRPWNDHEYLREMILNSIKTYGPDSIIPVKDLSQAFGVFSQNQSMNKFIKRYVSLQTNHDGLKLFNIAHMSDSDTKTKHLHKTTKIILLQGNEVDRDSLISADSGRTVLWSPDTSELALDLMTQVVFGGESINHSFATEKTRLSFGSSSLTGLLKPIDTIVSRSIIEKDTPGAQVVVTYKGRAVFKKAYGHFTYDSIQPITDQSIYDLASLTKALVTTVLMMKAIDDGKIHLDKPLNNYLPELRETDKEFLVIRDILLHESQLYSYVNLWTSAKRKIAPIDSILIKSGDFFQISDSLMVHQSVERTWKDILIKSKMKPQHFTQPYLYSDLGFIFLQLVIERVYGKSLNQIFQEQILNFLYARRTFFRPLDHVKQTEIVPTAMDEAFREEILQGWVHDRNAAVMNGVGGHAGLFSNAIELAAIGQMLLQDGEYGGHHFLDQSVIEDFTKYQNQYNRRGLGWDKPDRAHGNENVSVYCSPKTFGHTGFTGTCLWVDPTYDLVFVFLTNRVHPDEENRQLTDKNVRTKLLDVVYQGILTLKD